jgi:lysophospholipase L1-like esterase
VVNTNFIDKENQMKRHLFAGLLILLFIGCSTMKPTSETASQPSGGRTITAWLIGDSTMADYRKHPRYGEVDNPITGWGQVFQPFMSGEYLDAIQDFIHADKVVVDDRAVGGRTTRSFFEEGKWRDVYNSIKPGDLVFIQFGHNDAGIKIPEKYANLGYPEFVHLGYKEYLRFYVSETREKGGIPILLTPVARNYPWKDGVLTNVHGDFPKSVKEVAEETNALMIDLNQLSMDFFTSKGQEFVTENYFMNLPPGKFKAYPDGLKDKTHFQPEGAKEVARLVYEGLKALSEQKKQCTICKNTSKSML